jgi:serine O-acetyltransferase
MLASTLARSTKQHNDRARAAEVMKEVRARHPKLSDAIVADARITAGYRGERAKFRSRADLVVQTLRLMIVSDAFLAQVCYRVKARLQARGVPVLPRLAHRAAMVLAQVAIGDPVVIAPGLYLFHGQVVIDGFTEIGPGARIAPFVTIGLREGQFKGPSIGSGVSIGTGAKIIGPVQVGNRARIGANAVVVSDIPEGATASGIPARVHVSTAAD